MDRRGCLMRSEDKAQAEIFELLGWLAPSVVAFAIPNASRRTASGKASNAVPGLRKGVWDIGMILPMNCDFPGMTAYCEVKIATGKLSDEQKEFRDILIDHKIPCIVVWAPNHLDQIRHALTLWKVSTREAKL